ncbi:TetR/AcrR family transcriptional regulator [Marinobacter sp. 1Y8]
MPRVVKYDRQLALEKAVALFWQRGYYATSLKHIEQALDMRPGSLYAAFGSKSGLFLEALDVYAGRMGVSLRAHIDASDSVIGGISAYLRDLARTCIASDAPTPPAAACMIVKTLLEINYQDDAIQRKANEILGALEQGLLAVLMEARDAGELKPEVDCPRLARLLQAQIMGLRSFAQRDVPALTVEQVADDMVGILDGYTQKSPAH